MGYYFLFKTYATKDVQTAGLALPVAQVRDLVADISATIFSYEFMLNKSNLQRYKQLTTIIYLAISMAMQPFTLWSPFLARAVALFDMHFSASF